jgi:hypothetical protein
MDVVDYKGWDNDGLVNGGVEVQAKDHGWLRGPSQMR